jgi:hypothetical protein
VEHSSPSELQFQDHVSFTQDDQLIESSTQLSARDGIQSTIDEAMDVDVSGHDTGVGPELLQVQNKKLVDSMTAHANDGECGENTSKGRSRESLLMKVIPGSSTSRAQVACYSCRVRKRVCPLRFHD